MPPGENIDDLMLRWEAARRQGIEPRAEELCGACPQLAGELGQRIRAVKTMEQVFGVNPLEHQSGTSVTLTNAVSELGHDPPMPEIPGHAIIRVVDQGGMGIVYEARQTALGRTVAVKMISGMRLGPIQVARFRAEAEAAAQVQHPNLIQIFEVGQVNGRPFFTMEFVDGGSLAQLLAHDPPGARRGAELVEILAQAIHTAHERGIVHRDLKPSNVMLTAAGVPKIADFGLAKRLDDESGHTRTGEILGTPSYMAPEQAAGEKELIGPATDVYALGAILYELLAGRPPFKGASALDSLRMVTTEEPLPPSRLAPTPPDLEAICLKCLEKAPGSRYASALQLADDLGRFLHNQPVTARRLGKVQRAWKWAKRHRHGLALASTLGALAFLPVFFLVDHYRTQRQIRLKAEAEAPRVREILNRNCFECHGGQAGKVKKNLNILDYQHLLNKERRIIVPGEPADSRLIQRIADGSMPPEEEESRLPRVTEAELAILRDWVLGGAPPLPPDDPRHPTPPVVPRSELAAKAKAILEEHCYKCHKFDVAKGGIKILNYRLLVTVRKVVVPYRPDDSELFQLLTSTNEDWRMPPAPNRRLASEEIATIRRWIEEGAPPFPKRE